MDTYVAALTDQAARARRAYERLLEQQRLLEPHLGDYGTEEALARIESARRQAEAYESQVAS